MIHLVGLMLTRLIDSGRLSSPSLGLRHNRHHRQQRRLSRQHRRHSTVMLKRVEVERKFGMSGE